jgi:hypothetical protein
MSKADAATEIALDVSGPAIESGGEEELRHTEPRLPPPTGVLALIERIDPKTNADALEKMYALYERELVRKAAVQYNEAMNRAQAEIAPVVRTIKNPQTQSFYAKLEHVDRAIRPIYIKHGFALSDNTVPPLQPGNVRVECLCSHIGGHTQAFYREAPPDTKGPKGNPVKTELHGIASVETFMRRYLHCGIFNVVFEGMDDDGNGGPISEEEVQDILERMEQGKINSGKFLKYMRLPSTVGEIIAMIPKSDLGKALLALEELIKKAVADGDPA